MRPVYVRIDRPDGYEDVCGELVIADAQIRLPHEDVSEEIATLESALAAAQKKIASQASRIRTLEGPINHAGGIRDRAALASEEVPK